MDKNTFERVFPSGQRLEIVTGDLTHQEVDAIVNAANSQLAHGGGVAGVIVRRGGSIIQQESDEWVSRSGPVSHDKPALTGAGNLPCRYVIHAVGPVWGEGDEEPKLGSAIIGSLKLAETMNLRSIAFPAISTGIFGVPFPLAAKIFHQNFSTYFSDFPESKLDLVRIVLVDLSAYQTFVQAFSGS
jgi:O-acetyl-ADP-ribose deacetylase (regulator of RNase III)